MLIKAQFLNGIKLHLIILEPDRAEATTENIATNANVKKSPPDNKLPKKQTRLGRWWQGVVHSDKDG